MSSTKNHCLLCNKRVSMYKKFCCMSHAATYNNTHRSEASMAAWIASKTKVTTKKCVVCGNDVTVNIRCADKNVFCDLHQKERYRATVKRHALAKAQWFADNAHHDTPGKAVSKQKGTVGELIVAADLLRQGYMVFTEHGGVSSTDVVVMTADERQLIRVQVKSACANMTKRSAKMALFSGPRHRRMIYTPEIVDMFALYVYDLKKIVYVGWKDLDISRKVTECFQPTATVPLTTAFEDFTTVAMRSGLLDHTSPVKNGTPGTT